MTLPTPDSALRACVVVPARNEEALIGSCLEALAAQAGVEPSAYEVLLILDRCTDRTEARARDISTDHPRLRLHLLEGSGEGSGPARRVGMDVASARLLRVSRPGGLLACTDADTVVASDWLAAQLIALSRGARAIGGRTRGRRPRKNPARATGFNRAPALGQGHHFAPSGGACPTRPLLRPLQDGLRVLISSAAYQALPIRKPGSSPPSSITSSILATAVQG
jgi:glycosyltransferase involved in cell wall biosynthesis